MPNAPAKISTKTKKKVRLASTKTSQGRKAGNGKLSKAGAKSKKAKKKTAMDELDQMAPVSTAEMLARAQSKPAKRRSNKPVPRMTAPTAPTANTSDANTSDKISASAALPGLSTTPILVDDVPTKPWPWIALGVSVVSAGVGGYFGIQNQALIAEGEIERNPIRRADYQDRVYQAGLAANVLFSTAAVGAITSAILFATE